MSSSCESQNARNRNLEPSQIARVRFDQAGGTQTQAFSLSGVGKERNQTLLPPPRPALRASHPEKVRPQKSRCFLCHRRPRSSSRLPTSGSLAQKRPATSSLPATTTDALQSTQLSRNLPHSLNSPRGSGQSVDAGARGPEVIAPLTTLDQDPATQEPSATRQHRGDDVCLARTGSWELHSTQIAQTTSRTPPLSLILRCLVNSPRPRHTTQQGRPAAISQPQNQMIAPWQPCRPPKLQPL